MLTYTCITYAINSLRRHGCRGLHHQALVDVTASHDWLAPQGLDAEATAGLEVSTALTAVGRRHT